MDFEEIEAVDLGNDGSLNIRPFIQRVYEELKFMNINCLTDGIPQSGKSNVTVEVAYRLSLLTHRELKIIFEFDDFKKLVLEDDLRKYVIVYDEIQGSYDGWYDKVFQLLKSIFERFGFRGALLFIITPRFQNVYGLREYCRYGIWTEIRYSMKLRKYDYVAHFCLIKKNRRKNKLMEIEFQEIIAKPCPRKIWDEALRLKNVAYHKFKGNVADSDLYKHRHSWYYSRRKKCYHCRKCPIEVSLKEWNNRYMEGGN